MNSYSKTRFQTQVHPLLFSKKPQPHKTFACLNSSPCAHLSPCDSVHHAEHLAVWRRLLFESPEISLWRGRVPFLPENACFEGPMTKEDLPSKSLEKELSLKRLDFRKAKKIFLSKSTPKKMQICIDFSESPSRSRSYTFRLVISLRWCFRPVCNSPARQCRRTNVETNPENSVPAGHCWCLLHTPEVHQSETSDVRSGRRLLLWDLLSKNIEASTSFWGTNYNLY